MREAEVVATRVDRESNLGSATNAWHSGCLVIAWTCMNRLTPLAYAVTAVIVLGAFGCTREAKPPIEYSDAFVKFSYPANWSFEKEENTKDSRTTTVLTIEASDGFAMVQVFRPAIPIDGEEFAANVLRGMDEQLKSNFSIGSFEILKKLNGRKTSKSRKISGQQRSGVEQHATITILGQKFPVTQETFVVEGKAASVVLFYQSPDEDLSRDGPGYDLIFNSMTTSADHSGADQGPR